MDLGHAGQLVDTVSCWQIGRRGNHCGICVPCIIRRIVCTTHGVADSPYLGDIFRDFNVVSDSRARDNIVHLLTHIEDLTSMSDVELPFQYPELLNAEPAMTLAEAICFSANGLSRRLRCFQVNLFHLRFYD